MKTTNLIQGSPEWLAHRRAHFNASDAPAMMGCSSYKTRNELLHEMHTGISPEVDAATQRRFDDGHRFEELARPLAEAIVGEDLFPVTGTGTGVNSKLSASFDGLTMDELTAFEHKTLNNALRAAFNMIESIAPEHRDQSGCTELPMEYRVQMEQQCIVADCGKVLFMATKWEGDELVEERHCWYISDPMLTDQIFLGWDQFAIDLAAYVPTAPEVKAVGRSPETLPALHIEVTGMVTASNLADYKAHALAVFGAINRDLVTDQDFASAESTIKWCSDIETRVAAAKQHALGQTASIDALFRALDEISAEARSTRLEFDKLVKTRKDTLRADIVAVGRNALADHMGTLGERIGRHLMPSVPVDFANAIKGKRTLDGMRDAVAVELARAKIAANEIADRISFNLRTIDAHAEYAFLFNDRAVIVLKNPEDLQMLAKVRIDEHKANEAARLQAQRLQIEATERARADAEISAATAAAHAEAARASAQAIAKAQAEIPLSAPIDNEQTNITPVSIAPEAIKNVAVWTQKDNELGAPTLRLGQIGERLGFSVTADFMRHLGFEPAARDKSALLFHEADFAKVCAALVHHIQTVARGVAA